ncbi:MAG: HDIG domain-containing protein [Anaerolineales bacterium]|nr:HDIG domain-containing protein [Anaerolineales bacterium]
MNAPDRPLERLERPLGRSVIVLALTAAFWLVTTAIVAAPNAGLGSVDLSVGESATQDILAPVPISYVSTVMTERARAEAAAAVQDVYDAPDARVARQQVLLLRDILDYIDSVRADTFASSSQREADLLAIQGLALDTMEADLILNLDNSNWIGVKDEALSVLEQMMRSQVRADQVDDVQRAVPARVSVSLSESQAQVVVALVVHLIAPNSVYNETATLAARDAARQAVEPVVRQIVRGQAVVVRGQVITAEDLEELAALGLLEPEASWREPASAVLVTLLITALVILFVARFFPELGGRPRRVLLVGLLFTMFLLAARLTVPGRTVLPFLFPAAALSLLLTVFASPYLAMLIAIALAALVSYIGGNSLELMLYYSLGGILAPMAVGRGERLNQFFWAGLAVALGNIGVLLVFRLQDPGLDPLGLAQLLAACLLNGAISASLTLAGFFVLGTVFDITTSLQLIELARPDHPLLRFILLHAPGTYQHSLQVANLAEQAAERIGANAMLTRVGALYHDCGKALHPQFFVENQLDGLNIHDTLDPAESARIIIGHVHDGVEMARRHRLPTAVRSFIAEHHGTQRAVYQYTRAVQAAGGEPAAVEASLYVYPGPRPQSKETALLMLADGCEARARSERPKSEAEIDRLVKSVLDDRQAAGQLDDTGLTVRDLALIRESFVGTLKGVFHPRLEYPSQERPALPSPTGSDGVAAALPSAPAASPPPGQQPGRAS